MNVLASGRRAAGRAASAAAACCARAPRPRRSPRRALRSASGASGVPPTTSRPMPMPASAPMMARDRSRAGLAGVDREASHGHSPSTRCVPLLSAGRLSDREVACAPCHWSESEDRGAVRHLVLNRPEKRNALNGELIAELGAAIEAAAADDDVRVVVVRGEGAMFSSGMDLNDLRDLSEDPSGLRTLPAAAARLVEPARGDAQADDLPDPRRGARRRVRARARLRLPHDGRGRRGGDHGGARSGLLPDVGGCSRLPAVVGLGNAKELIMTGKVIDGREAHRIGFANRIAPAGRAGRGHRGARRTSCSPARRARSGWPSGCWTPPPSRRWRSTLEQEVAAQETLAASEDFAEGARAFFEKRDPEFAGR